MARLDEKRKKTKKAEERAHARPTPHHDPSPPGNNAHPGREGAAAQGQLAAGNRPQAGKSKTRRLFEPQGQEAAGVTIPTRSSRNNDPPWTAVAFDWLQLPLARKGRATAAENSPGRRKWRGGKAGSGRPTM